MSSSNEMSKTFTAIDRQTDRKKNKNKDKTNRKDRQTDKTERQTSRQLTETIECESLPPYTPKKQTKFVIYFNWRKINATALE